MLKVGSALIAVAVATIASFAAGPTAQAATDTTDGFGLVDPATGVWQLYEGGQQAIPFYYGNPGDFPFMGDWNCDGIDTPGLYRQSDGYVYLRNSNTQGVANISFFFGNPGDVPIAGDFNANGCDTVSIYRPSEARFYIINELGTNDGGLGAAEYSFLFGNQGDRPFIADFNGNGQDTIGLHRESTGLVYYRNTNTQGNAHNQFIFGNPGDRLIAGDWNGNGSDSPGLFRPSNTMMYLRYQNTQGNADESWNVGASRSLPVAGKFGSLPMPPPLAAGSGTGDDVVALSVPDVPVVIELTHDGASNFIVWSLDQALDKIDLLANEIGSYSGTRAMQFAANEGVSNLQIAADGNWSYEVRPLLLEPRQSCPVNGSGDSVVVLSRFISSAGTATLTHNGSSNFIVWAWGTSDRDLLVNEIGTYSGTVVVDAGLSDWEISADGSWTVNC